MNNNRKKHSVKLGSKFVIEVILIIVFIAILFLTISNYKSQINKANSHNKPNKNSPSVDEPELLYSKNDECLTYINSLDKIDYQTVKSSDFKDNLILYNTVYEDCNDGKCDNKRPLENYYIACLTDISYKSNNKTYSITEAIEQKILTIDDLEKKLTGDELSKVIIKETIEYDTTAPRLVLRDVSIDSGSTYKLDSFIISCTDNSGENCILSFTDDNMSKYTRVGTHNIEIIAKDSSGNETIKSARLIINTRRVVTPPPETPTTPTIPENPTPETPANPETPDDENKPGTTPETPDDENKPGTTPETPDDENKPGTTPETPTTPETTTQNN